MRGTWILTKKATGSSYAMSSLPVVFALYPELEPLKNTIYRQKKIETDSLHLIRVPMLRPEDVR